MLELMPILPLRSSEPGATLRAQPCKSQRTAKPSGFGIIGSTAAVATPRPRTARDRLLVARIREGDSAAFDELFCAYRNDLGAFVLSIVRSCEVRRTEASRAALRLLEWTIRVFRITDRHIIYCT
jgi:hypothetical protein